MSNLQDESMEKKENGQIPTLKNGTYTFRYDCSKCGLCCQHIDILLDPYDIYEMARMMKVNSGDLTEKVVDYHIGHNSHWPVALLKHAGNGICVFCQDNKCGIYSFRPKVCRSYPLGRDSSYDVKTGGLITNGYDLLKPDTGEPCQGWSPVKRTWTLDEWIEDSGVQPYWDASELYFNTIMKIIDKYDLEQVATDVCYTNIFNIIFNIDGFIKAVGLDYTQVSSLDKVKIVCKMLEAYCSISFVDKQGNFAGPETPNAKEMNDHIIMLLDIIGQHLGVQI